MVLTQLQRREQNRKLMISVELYTEISQWRFDYFQKLNPNQAKHVGLIKSG